MNRNSRLGKRRNSKGSRDSSASSSTREVRCGCQYFQTDSLLPERQSLVGMSLLRNMGDHEYEPISPIDTKAVMPPPVMKVTDTEDEEAKSQQVDNSYDNHEHHFIRIPLDNELLVLGGKTEEQDIEDTSDEKEISTQEHQQIMEDRYFAPTPTTTESRTDCEINTSQIDSSGLEELPLKKDARQSIEVKGIQSRIRSQAGKFRQKIRSISKPKLNSKEKPKIKLPEKPKINLPKQSRLKIPERPKFNFPQRPKISIPNFSFVKSKNTNSNLPQEHMQSDRSSSTGSNKNFFNSFRTYPRMFKKKKANAYKNGKRANTPPPKMETESMPPTPTSKKSNFSHQWTERYKDIKFADDESQSDKQKSFDDDVEDDSAPFRDTEFTGAINLEEFISKTLKTASSGSIQMSGKDQKSSVSSSERLQTGVIEEIDSDEFFLREKGLSREDVDISRFLSLEIRDAFRSPKNALASMEIDSELYDRDDYDLEPTTRKNLTNPMRRSIEAMSRELVEPMRMTPELEQNKMEEIINYCQPSRPTRTISLKKQSKQNKIEDFNTFPPPRPNRSRKQSISKESLEKYDIGSEESLARPSSVPSLSVSDTSKDQKFEIDKNSSSEAVNWQQPPLPPKRRKSSSKDLSYKHCLEKDLHENENWKRSDDVEIMVPEKVQVICKNYVLIFVVILMI
uniref:Uncharacterized protein n=1 Tax=Clastoptera arizonana TaxID=38151 RepID=A0A1B6E3B3_9HEMI